MDRKKIALILCAGFMLCGSVNRVQAAGTLKLNKTNVTLTVGSGMKLKVKNNSQKIVWKSENKTIAKVSKKGKVTAVGSGVTYITAAIKKTVLKTKVTVMESKADEKNTLPETEKESNNPVITMCIDYPMYDSAQELVDAADLVFAGEVKNITYEMLDIRTENGTDPVTGLEGDVSLPYTIFEIEVSEVYKGEIADHTIYLKRPGGNFDSVQYKLEDASDIKIGNRYLFLAAAYENSYASFINANQSSYDLDASSESTGKDAVMLSQIFDVL